MFALNLLGGAALAGPDGPVTGRSAHRRRLALLAILAVAGDRPVGRERLMGLLWADHPGRRARHLLSESLYVLRKELGEDAFVAAGDEVGLAGGVVRSDVAEFGGAVAAGELERAAGLYRGPFLDGFYVSGAPEFERWAEAERERLADAYARAVECLAGAAEREGRPRDAAAWWRRLAAHDPSSSRVGTRLMRALDASGERAAALWFADSHVAFLRDELGVEPEDDFAALVERLRSAPVAVPPAPPLAAVSRDGSSDPDVPADAVEDAGQREEDVREGPEREEVGRGAREKDEAAHSAEGRGVDDDEDRDVDGRERDEAVSGDGGAGEDASEAGVSVEAASPFHAPPVRWRSRRRLVPVGVLAGLLVVLAALLLPRVPADPPNGYDPRRIAVLYFDDHSPRGDLGYLANGLTEMLIHELSQVPALQVITRNGVKPYRRRMVPLDSMQSALRVGSVVAGSVQRAGDSVRVTVQLVDAATQAPLDSRVIVRPLDDVSEMEAVLAREVSAILRRRLGREVRLREAGGEARDGEALRLVLQAAEARDDAAELAEGRDPADAASEAELLLRADSLLRRAEARDPRWARPTLLRGWTALRLADLVPAGGQPARHAAAAAFAERVLAREAGSPEALELRGLVRWRTGLRLGAAPEGARLREGAERDLRAAVAARPTLATAWGALSQLLLSRGRFAEADLAARRALAADAYLDGAGGIFQQLFFGVLMAGDYAAAGDVCARARQAFPRDPRFVECRLTLMREDASSPPDAALAWRLVRELDRLDPPAYARATGRAYAPVYRRLVAASISARAGDAARARSELDRARAWAAGDTASRADLAYDEAYLLLALGERDAARRRLVAYLEARPAMRPFLARDPLFRTLVSGPSESP
jgi:DNA-binding SARP family transcriptional activator/TolB-like protein